MKIFLRIGTDTNVFWGDLLEVEWEYFEDDEMIFLDVDLLTNLLI